LFSSFVRRHIFTLVRYFLAPRCAIRGQSATAFFLGPNLNVLAPALTSNRVESIGAAPIYFVDQAGQAHGILVDGTHTLVVALVYAVIFAVTAIVLTWKRDVKE
jgi:ABC-2 type transport system permease protein